MNRINDTEITPRLFNEIVTRRKSGAKMFLVIPERTILDDLVRRGGQCCLNCDGAGNIGLQVIVSGPHDAPRIMAETIQGSDGPQKHNIGCIWYKERWYNAKTILDTCPCCQGSGRSLVRPERAVIRERVAVYEPSPA